jgi:UDP-GlcNAc:undecaprenyl-phosphate/decaprenyl-phosphate GlcNAc-1-phosphate transferase
MSELSPVVQTFFSQQFFLALLCSVALMPIIRRVSIHIGLIDHPGGRKQHKASVPLAGGPTIVFSVALSLYLWGIPEDYQGMVYAAGGLFLIGVIDDLFDISAKFRLVTQFSLVVFALYWDSIWLSQITFTDSLILDLGAFKYPITALLVLGIMNAINMLDGLDGLSSGVVLIILAFISGISVVAGNQSTTLISVTTFGSVLGFWGFNYRFAWREKASVFMGDSGTTVLGFVLPVLAIKLATVSQQSVPSSMLLWLFAIPLWDICAVVIKRLKDGKSPLQAGRDHIHHVLMNAGLSVRQSLHLIYLLTISTISFGVALHYFGMVQAEAYAAFFGFMMVYLGRVGSLSNIKQLKAYDVESKGDRRLNEERKVVKFENRKNTLS